MVLLGLDLYLVNVFIFSVSIVLYNYIFKFFVNFFTLPYSELSLVGLPFSAVTHKVVSKMTYSNLSSGTLNSTIVSGAGIILLQMWRQKHSCSCHDVM